MEILDMEWDEYNSNNISIIQQCNNMHAQAHKQQQHFGLISDTSAISQKEDSDGARAAQLIDYILIIIAIFMIVVAVSRQIHVSYNIVKIEEKKDSVAKQAHKWSIINNNQYFRNYQALLNQFNHRKHNNDNMANQIQYINKQQIDKYVQELHNMECNQYQIYQDIKQTNQQRQKQKQKQQKQYKQEYKQKQKQRRYQGRQQSGEVLAESDTKQTKQQMRIQQQKQDARVSRINQQAQLMQKQSSTFKQVAGISKQKLSNAKLFKTLASTPIWQPNSIADQEYAYYDGMYQIGEYSTELPFCVVVPTYNNQDKDRYKLNINSIVQQNYTNYHVVIIDDASTDNTPRLIDAYVQQLLHKYQQRGILLHIDVYHNEQQRRAMPNLRKAALSYCQPHQIYMIVDGDDMLVGRQFQAHNSWFVYSNFISFVGNVGFSRPFKDHVIQSNGYRKFAFVTSHLRAFYTQLFRNIKQEDLKDNNGEYFRAANDVAICIPILQMAHHRVHYIPEITYMYNSNTGLNNHLVRLNQQTNNSKIIRSKSSYQALPQLKFD